MGYASGRIEYLIAASHSHLRPHHRPPYRQKVNIQSSAPTTDLPTVKK